MLIGPFSRRGRARGKSPVQACDHDFRPQAILAPFGVLELSRGETEIQQLGLAFGRSRETSDFILDVLELWWSERRAVHPGVGRLQIELDNGPELGSSRTQFLKRLQEFADRHAPGDRAGVLSAVPQQVQPDRALLGGVGTALERHVAGDDRHGVVVGRNDDVEGLASDRS